MDGYTVAGAIGLALILIALVLAWYFGVFMKPIVQTGKPIVGSIYVAYKYHTGKYSECGPYFDELVKICPELMCVGIYYDDPDKTAAEKCRYIVGVILAEGNTDWDKELASKLRQNGFVFTTFPAVPNSVNSTFPFQNGISAAIGAYKVYPALMKYIKENRLAPHPFLEIYDDNIIHYMAPLSAQQDFYVPETIE